MSVVKVLGQGIWFRLEGLVLGNLETEFLVKVVTLGTQVQTHGWSRGSVPGCRLKVMVGNLILGLVGAGGSLVWGL